MAKFPTLKFPEYAPDISALGTGTSTTISGVVPRADGYGPFPDLQEFTEALPDACRGCFFARRGDGSIAVFAGTSTRLYLLSNTNFTWTDVSKGGSAYSTLVATDNWKFDQFNDIVIAVQSNTVPQAFTLSSSSAFADLGGSPPQASHIAIINRFVVLTGLLSDSRRVQWSDLDAPTTWTAGVGLSDFQDLPDGGSCHGLSGGDAYGVVFQDESIRTLVYAPGSAVVFEIIRISTKDSIFGQYSVINAGEKTFFCSVQGFKYIAPGGAPIPIGKERVDRFFFGDVDTGNLRLLIGATDPTATRVYWAYKSKQGLAGLFDKILCYDWSIGERGRWSLLHMSGECLTFLAKPGLTLEALDAIAPGVLNVTGTADNGSGAIRLELNALSNADFNISGQNFVAVYGVGGTTEANGSWPVTIIDSTHIDLVGSTYTNAWTSGGHVGGSLDALPFSLDSISTAAISQLSGTSPAHRIGFFNGSNIEAIIETSEQDGEGDMVFVSSVRPITDCADALVSIGYRNTAQSAIAFSSETAIDVIQGQCPQLVEGRYLKARFRAPAGSVWTYALGVQPNAQISGSR